MKRKPARIEPSATETGAAAETVAPQILDGARRMLAAAEKNARIPKCIVCSGETSAGSPDQLCWVCRRLKISAWRDVEQQMPAQE